MSNLKVVKYEVIADFPCSIYKKGDIIEVSKAFPVEYVVEVDDVTSKVKLSDYPDIYRLIEE